MTSRGLPTVMTTLLHFFFQLRSWGKEWWHLGMTEKEIDGKILQHRGKALFYMCVYMCVYIYIYTYIYIYMPGESMDKGAWWATVHGITKSWTRLSDWHTHTHVYIKSINMSVSVYLCTYVHICIHVSLSIIERKRKTEDPDINMTKYPNDGTLSHLGDNKV